MSTIDHEARIISITGYSKNPLRKLGCSWGFSVEDLETTGLESWEAVQDLIRKVGEVLPPSLDSEHAQLVTALAFIYAKSPHEKESDAANDRLLQFLNSALPTAPETEIDRIHFVVLEVIAEAVEVIRPRRGDIALTFIREGAHLVAYDSEGHWRARAVAVRPDGSEVSLLEAPGFLFHADQITGDPEVLTDQVRCLVRI